MAEAEAAESAESAELSENFAEDLATRVVVILQKQMDPLIGGAEAADYVYETCYPDHLRYYFDALELLHENNATEKFAGLAWNGLINAAVNDKKLDGLLTNMIEAALKGYYAIEKPDVELKGKKFSGYSAIMAMTFIKMVENNASNDDNCAEIYSHLVRQEMEIDAKAQQEEKETGHSSLPSLQKMYDDVIDFLATRSGFKAGSLNQDNPYEFVGVLLEKLRGSRRYVMQDVMNQRALEKKRQLEIELENQLAGAEEVVMAAAPFTEGLGFFVKEKRYNYKFLAVEKIRMTLQLLGSIAGCIYFLLGYMNLWGINWIDGVGLCIIMVIFSRVAGARSRFQYFYPVDVSKELEQNSTQFINVMRHMSKDQLEQFVVRQIKVDRNQNFLSMVPEYVKYLYAIMPDRKNMVITVDELSELVENSEIEVAKQLRGAG